MRRFFLPAFFIGLLFCLSGCGTQMENEIQIQTDLSQALNDARIDQVSQACVWVNRAIAVDPHAISTYVYFPSVSNQRLLGIASLGPADDGVFSAVGNNEMIVKYMNEAIANVPNNYWPYQVLDQAYGMLGDIPAQKADASALASMLEQNLMKPGNLHDEALMLSLAQAECDAGDFAKGTADYQSVIQAYPSDFQPYNDLAYQWAVSDSKPNLAAALTDANKALTLAQKDGLPDHDLAAFQDTLGWVQYRQGDYRDALNNVENAVSEDPREPVERYHLGMILAAMGQTAAAQVELDHAVLLAPGYADAQNEMAVLAQPVISPPATTPVTSKTAAAE